VVLPANLPVERVDTGHLGKRAVQQAKRLGCLVIIDPPAHPCGHPIPSDLDHQTVPRGHVDDLAGAAAGRSEFQGLLNQIVGSRNGHRRDGSYAGARRKPGAGRLRFS
jgi:hypothetical protein